MAALVLADDASQTEGVTGRRWLIRRGRCIMFLSLAESGICTPRLPLFGMKRYECTAPLAEKGKQNDPSLAIWLVEFE
jgi:hypothetical protein